MIDSNFSNTNYNCQMKFCFVIGQWPVLFTSVIGCCGAHATKDLQCFLPFLHFLFVDISAGVR
jgi:hypothetical protein